MDSVGRRPLLLGGVAGLVLSLLALSGAQTLGKGDFATWVSVVGLLSYTAAYQVGLLRSRQHCCIPGNTAVNQVTLLHTR